MERRKQREQENKAHQIFRKECLFFGKFGVLCFFVTTILTFALLPHYQRLLYAQDIKVGKTLVILL